MILEKYLPCTDALSDIFETKTNPRIQCCHIYPGSSENCEMTTWIDKES